MPHLWNNILVVTKEELVPIFWNNLNSLRSEIWRYKEKSYGIKQIQKGGNGRQMLIAFDSLSNEIQNAIGNPRKLSNPLEKYYEDDEQAINYYREFKRSGIYLKTEEQKRYIINASVLQATIILEMERTRVRKSSRGVLMTLCEDVINFNEVLKKKNNIEHNLPSNFRRFSETYKKFKTSDNEGKYFSLIKDPLGKSKNNARKVDDDTLKILNSLFSNIKSKPNPTEIYRGYEAFLSGYAEIYNEKTGEVYNPKNFKKLSESTVTSYLNKWENRIVTHKMRNGDRQKYMEKYKPHHQMEQPKFSNSLISIDDRQPPFNYMKGKRVWFYIGIDLASGCVINWVYGKSKEAIIIEFYRQLIRNYTEWGLNLPFGLECESSLNSSFKETFLKEGEMFQHVRIEANNARGKAVEIYNRAFRYELEKHREGWLARPTAKNEANQKSNIDNKIVPYDDIVNNGLNDIQFWNNMPSKQDKTKSRWEYFTDNQTKDLKPINWRNILPHLGYKTKSSCRVGYVSLQGQKQALAENGIIATDNLLINIMIQIEGKEIDIYWLDNNEGNIIKALAYYQDRYICEIQSMPKYNRAINERTSQDEINRTIQSKYVMTVEMFARSQKQKLDSINIIDNTPKVLNNKFQIKNLKKYQPKKVFDEIEILEDVNDDFPVIQQPATRRSWRDNF